MYGHNQSLQFHLIMPCSTEEIEERLFTGLHVISETPGSSGLLGHLKRRPPFFGNSGSSRWWASWQPSRGRSNRRTWCPGSWIDRTSSFFWQARVVWSRWFGVFLFCKRFSLKKGLAVWGVATMEPGQLLNLDSHMSTRCIEINVQILRLWQSVLVQVFLNPCSIRRCLVSLFSPVRGSRWFTRISLAHGVGLYFGQQKPAGFMRRAWVKNTEYTQETLWVLQEKIDQNPWFFGGVFLLNHGQVLGTSNKALGP